MTTMKTLLLSAVVLSVVTMLMAWADFHTFSDAINRVVGVWMLLISFFVVERFS